MAILCDIELTATSTVLFDRNSSPNTLYISQSSSPSHKQANHIAVQYGRGTLGVHIWELTGHMVNSSLTVSLTTPPQYLILPRLTDYPPARQRGQYNLLPVPRLRKTLPPILLPPAIPHPLVPTLCLRQYVLGRWIQRRPHISAHLCMHADPEELGCYNHRGKLHRPHTALHGYRSVEHDYGYLAASFAYSHGG
jgi:hypothetical protein